MATTRHPLPAVGTEFLLTTRRPWGPKGNAETETLACTVTVSGEKAVGFSVTEVIEVVNACDWGTPRPTRGGMSAAEWDRAVRSDRVHVIE